MLRNADGQGSVSAALVPSEAGFRLITLYQILHDGLHAKSGQDHPLKLQYIRTEKEAVMGWVWLISLSAIRYAYLVSYTDYSAFRNVHCGVPRIAEECCHQCSKCRCTVGKERRGETFPTRRT
jgi:hypothetical protein